MPRNTVAVPQPYASRVAALRSDLVAKKVDGFLLWNRFDQLWLTGFTGEDGGLLLTPDAVVLLTDGRFEETAEREAPFARRVVRKVRGPEATAKEVARLKIARLGFEPSHMSVRYYGELRKLFDGKTRLASTDNLVNQRRRVKDAGEIAQIRAAIRVAEDAIQRLRGWLKPGMKEREVAARLSMEMQSDGAQECAFGTCVASGANASLPHHEPGDTVITKDTGVLIDWGARVGWYVSDLTRVLWPGSIPPQWVQAYDVVREAHDLAIAAIRPGVKAAAVDRAARQHIDQSAFEGRFTHSVGHGIGLEVHESPGLRRKAKDKLAAGMVVTIEPGVYLPGKGGVRLESDVVVTETGCELLSSLPLEHSAWRI